MEIQCLLLVEMNINAKSIHAIHWSLLVSIGRHWFLLSQTHAYLANACHRCDTTSTADIDSSDNSGNTELKILLSQNGLQTFLQKLTRIEEIFL